MSKDFLKNMLGILFLYVYNKKSTQKGRAIFLKKDRKERKNDAAGILIHFFVIIHRIAFCSPSW